MKKQKYLMWSIDILALAALLFVSIKIGQEGKGYMSAITAMLAYFISIISQIIIHELGHLVFGLNSGYKFVSFSIAPISFIKQNNKIKIKKFNVPEASGQCLLSPPELVDGQISYKPYLLGGVLFNILSSIIAIIMFIFTKSYPLLIFAIVGIYFALINGIPFQPSMIANDAANIAEIKKDPNSLKSYYNMLKINAEIAKGKSSLTVDDNLFYQPNESELQNFVGSQAAISYLQRMISMDNIDEAKEYAEYLYNGDFNFLKFYELILKLELSFLKIYKNDTDNMDQILNEEDIKSILPMVKEATVSRCLYAYYKFYKKDIDKANNMANQFYKTEKNAVYPQEYEIERNIFNKMKERQVL